MSLHYHASGVVFNHNFTKEFYQKERKDCESCKTLADDVEQGVSIHVSVAHYLRSLICKIEERAGKRKNILSD